ncbi:MAG TPA: hypothetical protein VFJ24_12660 [Gaiellales bacterium]|nr:hypothetical protein [Gaiellales bacterium]
MAVLLVAAACGAPKMVVDHSGVAGVPAPRTDASTAYDAANGTIVMFGGVERSGNLDETWTWDGDTWRRRHPAHTPPARERSVMAFDPASGHVILFGGLACPPPAPTDMIGCDYVGAPTLLSDTWSWDGHDWSQVKTAHSPRVAYFSEHMVGAGADSANRQLVLLTFVKLVVGNEIPDTWTFRAGDWVQLHPKHSPFDMEFGGPAFDTISGRLLVQQSGGPHVDCFGSQPCASVPRPRYNMTWAWDGTDWKDLGPGLNTPHDYGTLIDAGRSGLMLIAIGGILMWNGSKWGPGSPLPWGDERTGWTGSFDAHSGQLIVYGGRSWETNHLFGDTMAWSGKAWSTVVAAPPSPSIALGPCDPGAAVAGYGGYGGGPSISPTSQAIGIAFFEPKAGPCHLDVEVTFTLTGQDGRPLPITGNPSHVEIVADLTYEYGFIYATFTITNACGLPQGTMATFGGSDVKAPFPMGGGYCPEGLGPITITPGTLHRPDEK